MPTAEILNITVTVAIAQAACDLLARHFIFAQPPYTRAVSAFERAKSKRDKAAAAATEAEEAAAAAPPPPASSTNSRKKSGSSTSNAEAIAEKNKKKLQKAEEEYAESAAEVAKRHLAPSFFSSLVFIVLFRILSTEHHGKVLALLPFRPWSLLRRLTMRGLTLVDPEALVDDALSTLPDPNTACSFLFIYVLCTVSVKYLVSKITAVHPPYGADNGIGTLMDAPKNNKILRGLGIDTDELKMVRGKTS